MAKAKEAKEDSDWSWDQRSSKGWEFGFDSEYTGKAHSRCAKKENLSK